MDELALMKLYTVVVNTTTDQSWGCAWRRI